jgi:hypothetical protein
VKRLEINEKIENLVAAYNDLGDAFRENMEEVVSEIANISRKNLIFLFKAKIHHLNIFEILLKKFPDDAIRLLKTYYLGADLSLSAQDQVEDLGLLLDDVKEILGLNKLEELLDCPEFLEKNKKNERVKEAVDFALDE